jgi:hypothetical protein
LEVNGFLGSDFHLVVARHMPLNATTYLEEHGWEGKGVALDGKQGRGLKKPLALPMKRNQRGLGKDRDRATEWWDCLFEVRADAVQGTRVCR